MKKLLPILAIIAVLLLMAAPAFAADGKPVFDDHAMGCSLCVDIATDVMKMAGEGKSPADIRQQIVATYSKFGPANQ